MPGEPRGVSHPRSGSILWSLVFVKMTNGPPTRLLRGPPEFLKEGKHHKMEEEGPPDGTKRGHRGSRVRVAQACRVGLFCTPAAPPAPPLHTRPSDCLPSHPHTHKGSEPRWHRYEQTFWPGPPSSNPPPAEPQGPSNCSATGCLSALLPRFQETTKHVFPFPVQFKGCS